MSLIASQEVSDFCNAHQTGGLGVASSNLAAPTIKNQVVRPCPDFFGTPAGSRLGHGWTPTRRCPADYGCAQANPTFRVLSAARIQLGAICHAARSMPPLLRSVCPNGRTPQPSVHTSRRRLPELCASEMVHAENMFCECRRARQFRSSPRQPPRHR